MILRRPIIWVFTSLCNLNCKHCYVKPRFSGLRELSLEEKGRLLREAGELGVEWIGLSGGEPLIHPHLPFIVTTAHDEGIELSIVTSGQALNEEALRLLGRCEVYVYLSLDGARPESHEALRGPGTWARVMRFTEALRGVGVRFTTVMAVNPLNYAEAGLFVELSEKLGADGAALIPSMRVGAAATTGLYASREQYVEALRLAEAKVDEMGYRLSLWCTPFARAVVRSRRVYASSCRLHSTVDIDPAGRVLLCDTLDVALSDVGRGLRRAVLEASRHSLVREVRRGVERCRGCELFEQCRGGCYARAVHAGGWLQDPDPLCPRASGLHEATLG